MGVGHQSRERSDGQSIAASEIQQPVGLFYSKLSHQRMKTGRLADNLIHRTAGLIALVWPLSGVKLSVSGRTFRQGRRSDGRLSEEEASHEAGGEWCFENISQLSRGILKRIVHGEANRSVFAHNHLNIILSQDGYHKSLCAQH